MAFFWYLFSKLAWGLLSLRYRIRVHGLDRLDSPRFMGKKGILFLPNHPAHMDPLFLFLILWPKFRMRPLVVEYIYRLPLLKFVMKLVRGLPIPNFDTAVNQLKIKKAERSMGEIAKGLKEGENFVLYPAGRLKSLGREVLGGSSGAHALVQECPDVDVVLVRTVGLWGSSFSRALLGRSPELPKTILHGIRTVLKNGIFFSPRRTVDITFELNPKELPRTASRVEFNRFLEHWYNRYPDAKGKIVESEPLTLVSYAFWKKDLPEVFQSKKRASSSGDVVISSETRLKIYQEIRRILDNPGIEIDPSMSLSLDLGMDSLNIAELIVFLARNYDSGEIHPEDVEKVQNVLEIAEGSHLSDRPSKAPGSGIRFPEERNRPGPALPLGRTVAEAFLHAAERLENFSACGDDLVGVLSYRKMRRSILVLAEHFKKMPDEKIAVLLPASAGAFLVILALECAGKIPVMLNWTLGPRYLDEMMKLSGAQVAISSWRFLEKLAHVEFGSLIDKVEVLEDIRQNLSLKTKLKGAFLSMCPTSWILRALHLDRIDEKAPCVILFTSGTEASPKGVPLSHHNILSNLRSAMQCITVQSNDCLYSILPPFHSFGFSVAGLFPLLGGLKVAYYPDPTDSFALAEGIERWKVTMFCSAPSFLKGLFAAAKEEQLRSVRLFVSGAEKASPELYQRVERLGTGAILAEGYGITECSPVLTLNRFNLPPKGVGAPLADIELCTVHPETLELLPKGSEGEICVRGPNVFSGYLGNPRSPFLTIEGKQWYRTGDLGYLDPDGNLILSGRLKRFIKLGGEMISLGAVERVISDELIRRALVSDDAPCVAVCSDEKIAGKPQLILFTIVRLEKEEVNEMLKNGGLSRLVKISSVHKVDEIPLMGAGKTDYRRLQGLI